LLKARDGRTGREPTNKVGYLNFDVKWNELLPHGEGLELLSYVGGGDALRMGESQRKNRNALSYEGIPAKQHRSIGVTWEWDDWRH